MISIRDLNAVKEFVQITSINAMSKPIVIITQGETITWKLPSPEFDITSLSVGTTLAKEGPAYQAILQKTQVTGELPASVYGTAVTITAIPLVDDAGEAAGSLAVFQQSIYPTTFSFLQMAPMLIEMLPRGFMLYLTDLEKITYKQASPDFELPLIQTGTPLANIDNALKAIQTRRPAFTMVEESRFGTPLLMVNYPLYNQAGSVIATFGIISSKKVGHQLLRMSENLNKGLSEISSAIEQLTATASQIYENEQILNTEIKKVISLSEEIEGVSHFIKEIADETKMLGLNAAIEAARAREAGNGFGVVAEEIRYLSEQSKSTVPKIKKLTDTIKDNINGVINKSNISLRSTEEQAASSQEITASIQEITALSQELLHLSGILTGQS